MQLLSKLPLEELTPARLWAELTPETRELAARSLYARKWEDGAPRQEADRAIASCLRFREIAVRRLPTEKRIAYLARTVRPDDSLAHSLLLALHLENRKELLGTFLESLGIPQTDGLIDADHELEPAEPEPLAAAVRTLRECYPAEQVEIYLASLLAMDPDSWVALTELLRAETDS